ncbi:MAG: DUF3990 domain-containing protein [Desulfococcaceae bacterium]
MCKHLSEPPEVFYHGTSSIKNEYIALKDIEKISIERGDPLTDFGQGFYLTSVYLQSLTYARRVANRHNRFGKGIKPIIIKYKLDVRIIKRLNGKIFSFPDNKWAEFIYNNRMGDDRYICSDFHNINKKYDYVYGHLADGKIAKLIEFFKEDCRSSIDIVESFRKEIFPKFPYNNDQLSLHSQRAVRCLEFLEVIEDEKYNPNHKSR